MKTKHKMRKYDLLLTITVISRSACLTFAAFVPVPVTPQPHTRAKDKWYRRCNTSVFDTLSVCPRYVMCPRRVLARSSQVLPLSCPTLLGNCAISEAWFSLIYVYIFFIWGVLASIFVMQPKDGLICLTLNSYRKMWVLYRVSAFLFNDNRVLVILTTPGAHTDLLLFPVNWLIGRLTEWTDHWIIDILIAFSKEFSFSTVAFI